MAVFSRRHKPADLTAVSNGWDDINLDGANDRPASGDGRLNTRPSFGQWLKMTWQDLVTLIVLGGLGIALHILPPVPSRLFPVYYPNGQLVYPQFAYPLRPAIMPSWMNGLLASAIPILIFSVMQIRLRSFWDYNAAVLGLLYSILTATAFQVVLKSLVGGLRPTFLDTCKPFVPASGPQTGMGFGGLMYNREVCTGDERAVNDSLKSFPSGHTTAGFAGFVFLSLYLNAKLKLWSNLHRPPCALVAVYQPILAATLMAGVLTIDGLHNWYDILAGAIIGTVMAFSAYRMVYASIWDFRYNHIPLTRHTPFAYDKDPAWTAWKIAQSDARSASQDNAGAEVEGANRDGVRTGDDRGIQMA